MISLLFILPIVASVIVLPMSSLRYCFAISTAISVFFISIAIALRVQDELIGISLGAITFRIDELSCVMILLTAFLTMLCAVMAKDKSSSYFALLFLLEFILVAFFAATDLLTFYIMFELSLVPIFFIIGFWGSKNRIYAAFKIFLYTLFGSIGFLISILYIFSKTGTLELTSLTFLVPQMLSVKAQKLIWLALFFAFAVKIPMFPFHTWLPDAHVQAPTEGSVMLAGILIKLGAYGMIRILLPIFPLLSHEFETLIFSLSAIGVIYTSVIAIMQTDMKKLVAYSSVAHMGIVTAGLFAFNLEGLNGAIFQVVSHALISSGLFFCIGCFYERTHTRKISEYSGIMCFAPKFGSVFVLLSFASIGLPGTSGFIGEFLSLIGLFQSNQVFGILCTTGVILGACYMLFLCKRIIWGVPTSTFPDMKVHEALPIFALALLVMLLGIYPNFLLNFMR